MDPLTFGYEIPSYAVTSQPKEWKTQQQWRKKKRVKPDDRYIGDQTLLFQRAEKCIHDHFPGIYDKIKINDLKLQYGSKGKRRRYYIANLQKQSPGSQYCLNIQGCHSNNRIYFIFSEVNGLMQK
jgi:hypothetical protein